MISGFITYVIVNNKNSKTNAYLFNIVFVEMSISQNPESTMIATTETQPAQSKALQMEPISLKAIVTIIITGFYRFTWS